MQNFGRNPSEHLVMHGQIQKLMLIGRGVYLTFNTLLLSEFHTLHLVANPARLALFSTISRIRDLNFTHHILVIFLRDSLLSISLVEQLWCLNFTPHICVLCLQDSPFGIISILRGLNLMHNLFLQDSLYSVS